jgi:hypothetical protein
VLYPSLRFLSIYWLTLWDLRLRPISLVSHVGWRFWEGEHEIWWYQSFARSDWDTGGSPYACSWHSIWHIVTSSLLCEHSHTLSLCLLEMWIALVLSWSRSMYYNCSILYLASGAAWFVHRFMSHYFGYDPCCSIMVFVFSLDVIFSWLVSTPVLRWVALVVHIFLVVDGEWVLLVIINDYSCSCDFCAQVIYVLTCFVIWVAYACLMRCLSSVDEILCSLL